VVDSPVSLRDLPVTVVDLSGLRGGSPFPGRSLAACWPTAPGPAPEGVTTPALSEQVDPIALQRQVQSGHGLSGFGLSLVASGHHYVRDGLGTEWLYDLRKDRFERVDLIGSPRGNQAVGVFRKMLLELLTRNPGSIEVEKAYLEPYRRGLEALVHEQSPERVAAGP